MSLQSLFSVSLFANICTNLHIWDNKISILIVFTRILNNSLEMENARLWQARLAAADPVQPRGMRTRSELGPGTGVRTHADSQRPRAHGPGGRRAERLLFSRRVEPPPGGVSERLSYHAPIPEEGSSAHVACAASSLDVGKGKRCVRGDWAPRQDVARPAAPEGRPAGPRAQMQPRGPDGARSSA